MEEYRRTFRFVVPGFIFIIEFLILLAFSYPALFEKIALIAGSGSDKTMQIVSSDPTAPKKFLEFITKSSSDKTVQNLLGIGTAIFAFLASGALGHIFGTIYYCGFHIIRHLNIPFIGIDHLSPLKDAENNQWILFKNRDGNEELNKETEEISQSGAWRIVTSFWNERTKTSKTIESADPHAKRLADILHSTGTTVVAAVIASLLWWLLPCRYKNIRSYSDLSIIFSIALPLVHMANYLFVVKDYQGVINSNVIHALEEERHWWFSAGRSTVIYVCEDDLKSKNQGWSCRCIEFLKNKINKVLSCFLRGC